MWADFTIRFAWVAVSCLLMAALAIVGLFCIPGSMLADVPVKLRRDLWLMTLNYISGSGMVSFGLYALRELAKERVSRQLGYRLGVAFAAFMWSLPIAGSAFGIAAWLAHQNGSASARVIELALAGFLAWTASFIFAGALLLEPAGKRPTIAYPACPHPRPFFTEHHRWT